MVHRPIAELPLAFIIGIHANKTFRGVGLPKGSDFFFIQKTVSLILYFLRLLGEISRDSEGIFLSEIVLGLAGNKYVKEISHIIFRKV